MKRLSILLIPILSVVFASCEKPLKKGQIVKMFYEPERTWTEVQYNIPLKMPMTQYHTDDEDFVIMVKGWNGDDTVTQRFEVCKNDYDSSFVGDFIEFQD